MEAIVYINFMFIEGSLVLHMIDEDNSLSATEVFESYNTENAWKLSSRCGQLYVVICHARQSFFIAHNSKIPS